MTTLLPPAPADRSDDLPAHGPAPTCEPAPAPRSRWDRLWHWLAVTGAAAGATSIAFGAPVSPMAVSRMIRPRPGEPTP